MEPSKHQSGKQSVRCNECGAVHMGITNENETCVYCKIKLSPIVVVSPDTKEGKIAFK